MSIQYIASELKTNPTAQNFQSSPSKFQSKAIKKLINNLAKLKQSKNSTVPKMRKTVAPDNSEQQFQNFLKNMMDVKQLLLQNCKVMNQTMENSKSGQKMERIRELEQEAEEYQRRIVILKAQLSCFKEKTIILLERWKNCQHALFNIINCLNQHLRSRDLAVKTRVHLIQDDTGEINIQKFQQFFQETIIKLSGAVQNQQKQGDREIQLKQKIEQLSIQLYQSKIHNQQLSYNYQSTCHQLHSLKKIRTQLQLQTSSLQKQLSKYHQQQSYYQQLIKDLDIKTRNRSDVILLFKGLSKKQRQHQAICPVYQAQPEERLCAKELCLYEEERKRYFLENRKKLDNVLDFQGAEGRGNQSG